MFIEKILFSKEECDNIIQGIIKKDEYDWDKSDRLYNSSQIEFNNETNWIFDRLKNFFCESTNNEIIYNKNKIHFHTFKKGDFFNRHNDIREKRIYSVGVILNMDFDGGDFKLYTNNTTTIKKETGNTYIFDVGIEHEITEVLNGIRYSLIWFLGDENLKVNKKSLM